MHNGEWVLCPVCRNKARTKIRPDTVLENFPLSKKCCSIKGTEKLSFFTLPLFLLNHLKMYECIFDCFSLIFRTLRNSVPLCLRKIIIDPLNNSALSFDLGYIKIRHLQPVFSQHVGLYFFIGCLCFCTGYFKL